MDNKTLDLLTRLSHGLAVQFGKNCEIIIHDIKPESDTLSNIVVIENGHVTGRKVGDGPSQAVLDAVMGNERAEDHISYFTKTEDGKILRSTTIYIRNEDDKIEGVFSINFDVTYLLMAENALNSLTGVADAKKETPKITSNVEKLLDDLIEQSIKLVGKPVALMTKDDKIKAINYLNESGAFLITRSGDKVASYFNISKFTLYNYIDMGKKLQEVCNMDFAEIKKASEGYLPQMTKFLRDLIAIPGESCGEEGVIKRIEQEMKAVGFDKVEIDPMGNILGYMGSGEKLIAFDAHIDTVGIGEVINWNFDPYEGYETDTEIGGRGASDQLGGIVSSVYGAKIMKDFGLIPDDITVLVSGTVQEEDCDGLCWQYIINEDKIKPEFVVITEPTDNGIYRGQRGRMEIRVQVEGVSCHGSAPERGDNAIYKMAEIIEEVKALNDRLHYDEFLGKGTLTVSQIFYNSPSRCAVADMCAISIDRRLTDGETYISALDEIKVLPSVKKYNAEVTMYDYTRASWTGLVYPTEAYFPTWVIPEDHPACKALVAAHENILGEPRVDKWTFSTNAVSIMGRYGIPCIGFGPGKEKEAHAPNEKTWKQDLINCAAVYAAVPMMYKG